MADNFQINNTNVSGGPTYRDLDRAGVRTQVVQLDLGGAASEVLAAGTVPVSGTFFQATQPVSGPVTDTQLRATAVPISGTVTANAGTGTLAVSLAANTPDVTDRAARLLGVVASVGEARAAPLAVVIAGGANAIATLSLPAAGAGLFHYITYLHISRVATAALAGGAILTVTSTNLLSLTWRTGNTMAIVAPATGYVVLTDMAFARPLRSAVANTITTVVGPAAGAAVSWHIECHYFTAA